MTLRFKISVLDADGNTIACDGDTEWFIETDENGIQYGFDLEISDAVPFLTYRTPDGNIVQENFLANDTETMVISLA